MTDYLGNGIGGFYVHRQSLAEGDYNYYEYIHRTGKVLIMRETIATSVITYADGGINTNIGWTGRVGLEYKKINEL